MSNVTEVCEVMCPTCPFRSGSRYASLQADLMVSALTRASRICHSTGRSAINPGGTGKPRRLCRGARNRQIDFLYNLGFLPEPTDAAWAAKLQECRASKR